MLECIHKYREYINNYLKTSFNNYFNYNSIDANINENLFEFKLDSDNKLNILGNSDKIYYVKGLDEIFIEFPMNIPVDDQRVFGIRILRKGKIFAGRFDRFGNLTGDGIYINKKGDLLIGEFIENSLDEATIYCYKGQTYDGTVLNLKKHGLMQKETSNKYEFVGDFENGKKIQGIYYPNYDKNDDKTNYENMVNNNNSKEPIVKSIEINKENSLILRNLIKETKLDNVSNNTNNKSNHNFINFEEKEKFIAKYLVECDEKYIFYTGCIENNKFNDLNALLHFGYEDKFPLFNGGIINNVKEGKFKYFYNPNYFFSGTFSNNQFISDAELSEESKKKLSKLYTTIIDHKKMREGDEGLIIKKSNTLLDEPPNIDRNDIE